jgi:ATP-dependent DNA helicase RecG
LPLPTFQNHSGGFLVTVFAANQDESAEKLGKNTSDDPVNDPVNDRLSKIKKLITNDKYITREELARRCVVSLETIKRDIQKLKNNNELKRIGSDKSGHWQLLKKNE